MTDMSVWQAQYSEPPERVAVRIVAAGPRLLSVWLRRGLSPLARGFCLYGTRCIQSLQKGLRRGLSPLAHGSCLCARRKTQSLQKGLRRGSSPLARASCIFGRRNTQSLAANLAAPDAPRCVAGAVLKASRKGCVAPVLSVWPAALPCGFGSLLCVNVVRGSCANRRRQNFVVLTCSCHAALAACCV